MLHLFGGICRNPHDWDTQPVGALDEVLDADADTLPDDQRVLIEEARTVRDGTVAQVRTLVTTLRASMDEQEGSA